MRKGRKGERKIYYIYIERVFSRKSGQKIYYIYIERVFSRKSGQKGEVRKRRVTTKNETV